MCTVAYSYLVTFNVIIVFISIIIIIIVIAIIIVIDRMPREGHSAKLGIIPGARMLS